MSEECSNKIQGLRQLADYFREKSRCTNLREYIDLMMRSVAELESAADELEASYA